MQPKPSPSGCSPVACAGSSRSGRDHEPQLQGDARRRRGRPAHRREGHRAARHRPGGRARGLTRGGGPGPRPRGGDVRRARGLPRHTVCGRAAAPGRGGAQPETLHRIASMLRTLHDGAAIPGRFDSFGVVEAYHATAVAHGVAPPAATETRRRSPTESRPRAARHVPLPQRPPERELHRGRQADLDRRLGVRGHGRPLLRSRELLDQPRARRRGEPRVAPLLLRRRADEHLGACS